jgi:hypothetical protein
MPASRTPVTAAFKQKRRIIKSPIQKIQVIILQRDAPSASPAIQSGGLSEMLRRRKPFLGRVGMANSLLVQHQHGRRRQQP